MIHIKNILTILTLSVCGIFTQSFAGNPVTAGK